MTTGASTLQQLRSCKDIYDLADLLGLPAKALAYRVFGIKDPQRYHEFCISKKNGKSRKIYAPHPDLKALQKALSGVLQDCFSEIDASRGPSRNYGFVRGRGIYENCKFHSNKRYVFNLDLKDFFPSINFGRVRGFFLKNENFSLTEKVATLVAQICCHQNQLPQGSPTSPIVSALVCGFLDYRLSAIAGRYRCRYSTYADDIVFSTNLRDFPTEIAVCDGEGNWVVAPELESRIKDAGFEINESKTRMSVRGSRQMVTGLISNKFPNIPAEFYKNSRASVHYLMKGRTAHLDRFCEPFQNNCTDPPTKIDPIPIEKVLTSLNGRLSHCRNIYGRRDDRDDKKKFFVQNKIDKLYDDFLRFRHFVHGTGPILLAEGLSDILYLKASIAGLSSDIKHIATVNGSGDVSAEIGFYRPSKIAAELFGIVGGTRNFPIFLERHRDFLRRLGKRVPKRPLVVLVDNDEGIDNISKRIRSSFDVNLKSNDGKDYYILYDQVVIVKTPEISGKGSAIEDFLPKSFLNMKIDGKKFSRSNEYDSSKFFGKMQMAKKVYEERGKVKFQDLRKVLKNISKAVDAMP